MHTVQPLVRTASWTRPADTTQYGVGDSVADNATTPTAATFTLVGMAQTKGLGGIIHSVVLHKTDQDQTGADFDIYFFDTQPVAAGWEDNAAIAITDAEWKKSIGFVALTASTDARSVGNVTGIAGGTEGREVTLFNVGSFNIVLVNASVLSVAANRFSIGANLTLTPGGSRSIWYDAVTSTWRII